MTSKLDICENCGHGVSIHEWEDESTSCCLFAHKLFDGVGEGKPCMCPGFKPKAAWQNAAESLPARPEQVTPVAGVLSHEEHRSACMYNLPAYVFGSSPKPVAPVEGKEKPKGRFMCWTHEWLDEKACPFCEAALAEPKPTPSTPIDDLGRECIITRDTHRLLTETSEDFADRMRRQLIQERRSKPQPDSWEQEIKEISIAVIQGSEIPDASKNVVIRNLVWAIKNRTKPQTELCNSVEPAALNAAKGSK